MTEEEVSLLLGDVVPTASRLRPREGRTRAIARTRQSERVRATVNRNRMSTAQSIQVGTPPQVWAAAQLKDRLPPAAGCPPVGALLGGEWVRRLGALGPSAFMKPHCHHRLAGWTPAVRPCPCPGGVDPLPSSSSALALSLLPGRLLLPLSRCPLGPC